MPHTTPTLWPLSQSAAIFDFDGTLAITADIWHEVDVTFLSRRGLTCPADYGERMAALGFEDGARYTIERFGLTDTPEAICDEWNELGRELYATTVRLRPGAEDYIRALLAAGIPCALATTNDPAVLAAMEHVDVFGLFDACVFGKEVGRGKDHPDIYLEAASRLGVAPTSCIVFEDIAPAIETAKRIGMLTCGVYAHDARQNVDELKGRCDLWLDDWRDIERR